MISITESVTISKPVEEVFSFACDYRHDPTWRTGVRTLSLNPEGLPQVGTRTREVMHFMGQKMITEAQVTRYEPEQQIAFEVTRGPIPASGYRLLENVGDGTRFTYHIEAKPVGFYRLLAPVMEASFRRRLKKDLLRLKHTIESSRGAL